MFKIKKIYSVIEEKLFFMRLIRIRKIPKIIINMPNNFFDNVLIFS